MSHGPWPIVHAFPLLSVVLSTKSDPNSVQGFPPSRTCLPRYRWTVAASGTVWPNERDHRGVASHIKRIPRCVPVQPSRDHQQVFVWRSSEVGRHEPAATHQPPRPVSPNPSQRDISLSGPCLVPKKFYNIFQIPRHIESLDVWMKY